MTLDEMLALLPDNSSGQIGANDLRAIVTGLYERELVYNLYAWQFSNAAPPPTGNQVRLSNVDPTLATMIEFRKITADGFDASGALRQMGAGSRIKIADWDNEAVHHRWSVSGPTTVLTDSVQVPVTYMDGAGTLPNAKVGVGLVWLVTI